MSHITGLRLENGNINSYYGCQLVGSVKATPQLIKKYGLKGGKCISCKAMTENRAKTREGEKEPIEEIWLCEYCKAEMEGKQ